jgi:hypothetical protein
MVRRTHRSRFAPVRILGHSGFGCALGCALVGLIAGGLGWPGVAVAQARAASEPSPERATERGVGNRSVGLSPAQVAERQRLRGELERVQNEIDLLKKGDRGLRSDYRLRARMADAEALARRLTELDALAKTSTAGGPSAPSAGIAGPLVSQEPTAAATDGPAELEAKADILADQSRRVKLQVVALKARIDQVRGRQELRRRAHQLDNDPFAPLEGSKRRMVTVTQGTAPAGPTTTIAGAGPPPTPSAPAIAPGVGTDRGGAASGTTSVGTTAAPTPTTPPLPTPGPTSAPAPTVQLHDMLDPNAPAQGRKPADPEGLAPSSDLASMQRMMAALLAQAQHLDTQSNLLRAQARTH